MSPAALIVSYCFTVILNFPEADFWDTILCQFFVHLAKPVDSFVWRDDRCAAFFLVRG